MKKDVDLVTKIFRGLLIGIFMLLVGYIFVYFVGGQEEYSNAIIKLSVFKNLIFQITGCWIIGLLYIISGNIYLKANKNYMKKNATYLDLFKGMGIIFLIILLINVGVIGVHELLLSKTMTETLKVSMFGMYTVNMLILAIWACGVSAKEELNRKLKERNEKKEQ